MQNPDERQPACPARGIDQALTRAAEIAGKRGGQVWLAHRLGVTQQAVSLWSRRGWVPTNRADEIQQLTGVPARELMNPRLVKMLADKVAA
jgi:hypothetical protein